MLIYPKRLYLMEQEQSQSSVKFENEEERRLFEVLTTKIKFQQQTYSDTDLTVDLVLRLPIPRDHYIPRSQDYDFDYLFANAPDSYMQAYQTVKDYINYQVENDPASKNFLESVTKLMKSLIYLEEGKDLRKRIRNGYEEEYMDMNSFFTFFPDTDVFTLRYNMIMLILQSLCGFRVKSFIFQEGEESAIYFLLTQNIDNLLKLANQHQIMKEYNMDEIDYSLNDPVDSKERPLRFNNVMLEQRREKMFSRVIKSPYVSLKTQLIDEQKLSDSEIKKYQHYLDGFEEILKSVYSNKVQIGNFEKQYIFNFNRHKINEGCQEIFKEAKQRQMVFDRIIALNQQFDYPYYRYQDTFFEFRLPPKKKAFFSKFEFMLKYRPYVISPQGQISLFNKMERTKLSNFCLERYLKLENLHRIGLEVFTLNDDFEKYGKITFEHSKGNVNTNILGGLNGKRLIDSWHGYIPMFTDIRVIREYMGEKFAYEIMTLIHLIGFLLIAFPLSLLAQILGIYIFEGSKGTFIYQFNLIYLVIEVTCLTVLCETWKRKEDHYFKYYVDKKQGRTHKQNYSGPFVRNLVTDEPNEYPQKSTKWSKIYKSIVFVIIGVLLVFEGLIFYGLRKAIVYFYPKLPQLPFQFISLPHLIFYGVFFIFNYLSYQFIFSKLIHKLTEFQNISTKKQFNSYLRTYTYVFTFGVELIGPFFLYVIEPFQGNSCYSSTCIYEFEYYIYSRFIVILAYLLVRFGWAILNYFETKMEILKEILNTQGEKDCNVAYETKYSQLLQFVNKQYKKENISVDMRGQALSLYYYCIFSIAFPFCAVISCCTLVLDYIIVRMQVLRKGRRPISSSTDVIKLSQVYVYILHCCIIVNIWSIIFVQQVIEYNYVSYVESLVADISVDSLLMLKLATIFVIIIIYEIYSGLVKRIYLIFVDDTLQNRKVNIYENFLHHAKKAELPTLAKIKQKTDPLRTVFRTFSIDDMRVLKRAKFKSTKHIQQVQDLKDRWLEKSMKSERKRGEGQLDGDVAINNADTQNILVDNKKI